MSGAEIRATSAAKAVKPAKGGSVLSDLPLWDSATRIGGGITPSQITEIIRQADTGAVRRLIDLANECRQRDCHLQAVWGVKEESISGLPWQIVAPVPAGKKKARSMDERAAKWVEDQLKQVFGMRRAIADLVGAFYYGFSVLEILWKKVDGGRLAPTNLRHIAQRRFEYRRDDGRLVLHDSGASAVDLAEKYPDKFVTFFARTNGDAPVREGLARSLVWISVFRNWGIADWLKTGESTWKPWIIAYYSKKEGTVAAPEDIESLETVARRMTTEQRATLPDTTQLNVTWPQGATQRGSAHAELVNQLGNEISKAVLGQTETTQASSSSGYAQAKVHEAVRKDLLEGRARQIAEILTRDLVEPMVRLNFGEGVKIPRFEFVTQDSPDLKSFSDAIAALRTAGARIPEVWFHEAAGIPRPDDGETLLGGAVVGEKPNQNDPNAQTPGEQQQPNDAQRQALRMLSGHPVPVALEGGEHVE